MMAPKHILKDLNTSLTKDAKMEKDKIYKYKEAATIRVWGD